MKQAALITEGKGLIAKKIEEFVFSATDDVYLHSSSSPYTVLREVCSKVATVVKKLAQAMENGEYDFDGTQEKRPMPPVMVRAMGVRQQMNDTENLKAKLENKEEHIKELKTQLKLKQEEISEQQVRVRLIEKKLENSGRETNEREEKLRSKLDEAHQELQRKQKEYDDTLDALQGDVDALEAERMELKEKLKMLSKKTLLEGLTRQTSSSALAVASERAIKESPLLLQENEALREALKYVKDENVRLRSQKMKEQMMKLKPLKVPKRIPLPGNEVVPSSGSGDQEQPGDRKDLTSLTKDTRKLLNDLYTMCASPKVIDISNRRPGVIPVTDSGSPYQQLLINSYRINQMKKSANELQVAVTNLIAANRQGGQVRTDFSTFPTSSLVKVLQEKQGGSQCVGTVSIPVEPGKGALIPVEVSPSQLKTIHARFVVSLP
jgi:dynactin 1